MKIEYFTELPPSSEGEWQEFLRSSPHSHPRQDPRFAEIERAIGNKVVFTIGKRNGVTVAVGLWSLKPSRLFPTRFSEASALSGPVCDTSGDFIDFLGGIANSELFKKVNRLSVTPYWLGDDAKAISKKLESSGYALSEKEPFRSTGLIDVAMPREELIASFSQSTRNSIHRVDRSEVEIRAVTNWSEAQVFYERLNSLVLAPNGLTTIGPDEQRAQFEHIHADPSIGALFAAYHEGTFLAGLALYRSHHSAHGRRYVADRDAAKAVPKLRLAPAIWLQGMTWARDNGCKYLDVEGFKTITDRSDPLFNVYEYKRQMTPELIFRTAQHGRTISPWFYWSDRIATDLPRKLRRLSRRIRKTPLRKHARHSPANAATS